VNSSAREGWVTGADPEKLAKQELPKIGKKYVFLA
jgi:hypothetical protein